MEDCICSKKCFLNSYGKSIKMYWAVSPLAEVGTSKLFLTNNSSGNFGNDPVTVTTQSTPDQFIDEQLWIPIFSAVADGFVLLSKVKNQNKRNDLVKWSGENDSPAQLVEDGGYNEQEHSSSTCIFNLGNNNNDCFAIRPVSEPNMNLNVRGNPPYSSNDGVLFWTWGDAGNDQWQFVYVSP